MSVDDKDTGWQRARDPATFSVTGGSAFALNLDSLRAVSAELVAAASSAGELRLRIEAARRTVRDGACPGSAAAAQFDDDAARLVRDAFRAQRLAGEACQAVVAAASAYEAAEGRRASDTGGLQEQARAVVSRLGTAFWVASAAAAGWPPGRLLGGVVRTLAEKDVVQQRARAWVPVGSGGDPIAVRKARVLPGSGDPASFAYAGQSLRQAQTSTRLDGGDEMPPSSVMIERFTRPDGSVAVMLTVPGTQSWAGDDPSGNVFDGEGNLDAMGRRDSHARQLIDYALADQRLRNGDVVVINAHSQGALHVFGLLEDPSFTQRYPVAAVTVLGGTPTAFAVPPDLPVLSVSNVDDVVPGLSGVDPVPRPNLVQVVTPAHRDRTPEQGLLEAVQNAHSIDRYAMDAQALDSSADPSVVGYAAVLVGALGMGAGAGAPVARERFVYSGRDPITPATPPQPPASSGRKRVF